MRFEIPVWDRFSTGQPYDAVFLLGFAFAFVFVFVFAFGLLPRCAGLTRVVLAAVESAARRRAHSHGLFLLTSSFSRLHQTADIVRQMPAVSAGGKSALGQSKSQNSGGFVGIMDNQQGIRMPRLYTPGGLMTRAGSGPRKEGRFPDPDALPSRMSAGRHHVRRGVD